MKKIQKISCNFFLLVLILIMMNTALAFPITGRVIEISASETKIIQEQACSMPICSDGSDPYNTGEVDANGCGIYSCPEQACVSCIGGIDTGKVDSNGCPIYSCPDVGCTEPICEDGEKPYFTGEYDKYGCKIYRCYEFDCPENCICEDGMTTCPTTQQKPIEVEISTSEGSISISLEKVAKDTLSIKEGVTSVKTSKKLVIKEKKLLMETSQGNKEIKIMPSTVSETAINQLKLKNYEIELKEIGKPVYEVTGRKEVRFMGLFKVRMMVKSQINAETGSIEKTEKPWWSFLASG